MSDLPLPRNRVVDRSKIEDYLLHSVNGRGNRRNPPAVVFTVWQADTGSSGLCLITSYPA